MDNGPRQKELENKVFCDKDGVPYEGHYCLSVPNPDDFWGDAIITDIKYKGGKLHGSPGIFYPDGLEEIWEDGKYVGVLSPPFGQRGTFGKS